jgi:hypothetical protein
MKSLNSMGDARRTLLATGIGVFIAFLFLAPLAVTAAGSVTLTLDKTQYVSGATIHVSGTVTPAPSTSGTEVAVTISGPTGGTVDANQFAVSSSTGNYNGTFVAGGPLYTVNGTYTISAAYNGATASQLFQYGQPTNVTGGGTTTTVIQQTTTTVVQAGATTTVVQPGSTVVTTIVQQGATVVTTVTQAQQTTVTLSYTGSDTTGIAIGAVALIIAIIAIVMAVLFMRKK